MYKLRIYTVLLAYYFRLLLLSKIVYSLLLLSVIRTLCYQKQLHTQRKIRT